MNWTVFKKQMEGKKFVIGITFVDSFRNVLERYQTSGMVLELTDRGIFIFERNDHSIFILPYDPNSIEVAHRGEYREKTSGKVIVNPDYLTQWEVEVSNPAMIHEFKQSGFSE